VQLETDIDFIFVYYEYAKEPELLYDGQFTANQFVLAPNPLRLTARFFFPIEHLLL
jgi:hypothetical protein